MPTGRDRRHRLPAAVGVLLGTLLVLAGCGWAAAAPAAEAGYAPGAAVVAADAGTVPVPGCGLPDGDDGARPGMPPRGSAAHEPLPATQQLPAGCAGALPAGDGVHLTGAVLRGPPPLCPPSPVALSVLRV
ncbi:hypothetical protein [Streptomyces sp. t39]|uniref:hypothetical protein n=1 Tax=Streptomyces sp. t39 TaxID=1828156 RepID=UPI0011CDF095|nr:hypothetical protein [Streptomyces sp. t39]TXS55847.1 hypothetical protein EAO77_06550 [Streptomyces sp. t39]